MISADMPTADAVARAALDRLDLAEKVSLLTGVDFWRLPAIERIGLRAIAMSDGPIGIRGCAWAPDRPSVALPAPSALAATWDVRLAEAAGRLLGAAARRRGVDVLLAPMVNLHRSPLAGRHFECYSEDPLLTGEVGAAYVAGVQQAGVAAVVKGFVANDSETERLTVDVRVSERALRELYLASFETIVRRARPWAVMAAYNRVNGVPMTENRWLLQEVLKGEWGFDGLVISDWTAARTTVATAVAGLDVAMPADGSPWGPALVAAVAAGEVDEAVVDEQALRVLRLAHRVGALGRPADPPDGRAADDSSTSAQEAAEREAELARRIAARSFVLAVNRDGVLPLDRAVRRVAVLGALASDLRPLGGGSAEVEPLYVCSLVDGLAAALPSDVELVFRPGTDPRRRLPPARGEFRVRVFDRDGRSRHAVATTEAKARWFGNPPGGMGADELARLELTGTVTPRADGDHVLAVSGVGGFTLWADGTQVASAPVPRADPGELFGDPPEVRVVLPMRTDRPVALRVVQDVLAAPSGVAPFVSLSLGCEPAVPEPDPRIDEAAEAAAGADVAVVVVGTTEETESEGFDRTSLSLPGRQDELVARVAAVNPRTVVVVNAGAPVLMPWAHDVAAILLAWFPGQEGGRALADVLLGAAEPGGRLPTTWPARAGDCPVITTAPTDGVLRYDEGPFIGYRAWQRSGRRPLFPFGHGLGYTSWAYESISTCPGDGLADVRVRVRNTGGRRGREVVQVYLRPAQPDGDRPLRWLAGFAVAEADPGEAVEVVVPVAERAVQVWTPDGWRTVPGAYVVEAARSADDCRLSVELVVGSGKHERVHAPKEGSAQ
jgi:beta-glucosidase